MDAVRQSVVAGVVVGAGVAVLGAAVILVAAGIIPATLQAPRPLVGTVGIGIALCGFAFAVVTLHRRLGFTLAIPGAALAFLLPLGWAIVSDGTRQCMVEAFSIGASSLRGRLPLGDAACSAILALAAALALAVVAGMLFAWRALGEARR